MIEAFCIGCGDEIEGQAALLLGPSEGGRSLKDHVCEECYDFTKILLAKMRNNATKSRS